MDDTLIVIFIFYAAFLGIPALFVLGMYLEEKGIISEKGKYLYITGIMLIPYIVSVFFGEGFLVFWAAYTFMLLTSLAIIWYHKVISKMNFIAL